MSEVGSSGYLLLPSTAMYDLELVLRLRRGLAARGFGVVVVTHLISVANRTGREGVPCILVRGAETSTSAPRIDISTTHEGRQGLLTAARACCFARA